MPPSTSARPQREATQRAPSDAWQICVAPTRRAAIRRCKGVTCGDMDMPWRASKKCPRWPAPDHMCSDAACVGGPEQADLLTEIRSVVVRVGRAAGGASLVDRTSWEMVRCPEQITGGPLRSEHSNGLLCAS